MYQVQMGGGGWQIIDRYISYCKIRIIYVIETYYIISDKLLIFLLAQITFCIFYKKLFFE